MTKTGKILQLLNDNPNLGYRASYLAEYAGVSKKNIYPLLYYPIQKGIIEKLTVSNQEVYYIKSESL